MKKENKQRSKKRILIFGLLNIMFALVLLAIPVYAFYWESKNVDKDIEVEVGEVAEGLIIVTDGELSDSGKKLIPSSSIFSDENNETKSKVYTIVLGYDIDEQLKEENLDITITGLGDNIAEAQISTSTSFVQDDNDNLIIEITFTLEHTAAEWKKAYDNRTYNIKISFELK